MSSRQGQVIHVSPTGVRSTFTRRDAMQAVSVDQAECAGGKRRYPTETMAEEALRGAIARRSYLPWRLYECGHCSGWHLTSRPEWEIHQRPESFTFMTSEDRRESAAHLRKARSAITRVIKLLEGPGAVRLEDLRRQARPGADDDDERVVEALLAVLPSVVRVNGRP